MIKERELGLAFFEFSFVKNDMFKVFNDIKGGFEILICGILMSRRCSCFVNNTSNVGSDNQCRKGIPTKLL